MVPNLLKAKIQKMSTIQMMINSCASSPFSSHGRPEEKLIIIDDISLEVTTTMGTSVRLSLRDNNRLSPCKMNF